VAQFVDAITVEGKLSHVSKVCVPRTQATAVSTLSIVVGDSMAQYFTGATAGQIVQLPNATTLAIGQRYEFFNMSSQTIQVKDGSGANLFTLSQSSIAYITLQTNGSSSGGWIAWQVYISSTASGILNYELISTTTFTTGSTTDVAITGFSVTPQSGRYALWYSGQSFLTTTPKTHWWSFYKGGSQITDSERSQDTAHSSQKMNDSTQTIESFNGTDVIDVRVRTQNGSMSIYQRSLILIRLGS